MLGFLKTIFFNRYSKKPLVSILFFIFTFKLLNELNYYISLYLEIPSDPSYNDVVWAYSGLGTLSKNLFQYRDRLIDFNYVGHYYIFYVFILTTVLAVSFKARFKKIFAPGRSQHTFERMVAFLNTPNTAVFFVFLILFLVVINGFLTKVQSSFLTGANRRLSDDLNKYTESRLSDLRVRYPTKVGGKAVKLPEPFCIFHSQKHPQIYDLSYPDFLYLVLFGNQSKLNNLEKRILELPPALEVVASQRIVDAQALTPNKETYSRSEVEGVLRRDRELRQMKPLKMLAQSKPYLLLDYLDGKYAIVLVQQTGEEVFLGLADFKCSTDYVELHAFNFSHLVRFDF